MDCKDGDMDCRKVMEFIFLFFDGELGEEVRGRLEHHLSRCPGCSHRLKYTRKLLILVRERCTRQMAPPRLRHRILNSLPHRQKWT